MSIRLQVRVQPRSSRRGVETTADGTCVVRVTEPAEDGRANDATIKVLAEHFGVAPRLVTILRGVTARRKVVEIAGLPEGVAAPERPAVASMSRVRPAAAPLVVRIVSGGQTGVDRAALDVAFALGVPCGGWCPRGRRAEDGTLPSCYPLKETPSEDYVQRTTWNVRDSDGTLILNRGPLTGGTWQTAEDAARLGKPHLVVDLAKKRDVAEAVSWLTAHRIRTLNVAGPRESKSPGVYATASKFLREILVLAALTAKAAEARKK